jgi:SfnB family sulfur acquisition oxidoreductase
MTVPAHVIASDAEAIAVATSLAAEVAPGAAERDRLHAHPVAELRRLGLSGLLGIIVPTDLGGAGASFTTLGEVLRLLSAADASFAQTPQPHYVTLLAVLLAGTPEQRALFAAEVLAGRRFGNALSERGTRTSMDYRTTIRRDPAGFWRLDGRKFYCTGSISADWVPTYALDAEHRLLLAYVPRAAAGLQVLDDWQAIGQRGTASGTVTLDDVHVPDAYVVALWRALEGPQIWNAFARFLHAAIDVGIAEGALHAGAAFLRTRTRPWTEAGVERASDEPHILLRYGELVAELAAATALVRRAGRELDAAWRHTDAESAARASAAVAEAKAYAADIAVTIATEIFATCGTSAADEASGLGRYWRDARTHTVHDPVRWSHHSAGYYAVHGTFPRSRGHGGAAGSTAAAR